MSTLHLTVGLPGSGKSTWARRWVQTQLLAGNFAARVSRDSLRDALHAGCYDPAVTESAVTVVQLAAVDALLAAGWDVVVDDTNLRSNRRDALEERARNAGHTVELHDFTHVPLDECIRRDAGRPATYPLVCDGSRVTEPRIRAMHDEYLAIRHEPAEVSR